MLRFIDKLLFINFLIPTTISTTDVCCRLYQIRDQLRPEVGNFALTPGFAGNASCDFHDICRGLQRDGDPISCKEAFELLTRHNERPPLETPPILMPAARYWDDVSSDMQESLRDKDSSRERRDLEHMSSDLRRDLYAMRRIATTILSRTTPMFPRFFYAEEIDGALYRELVTLADAVKLAMNRGDSDQCLVSVIKFLHRSRWIKHFAVQMASLVRYVAQLSLVEMEIAMISIAPTMHAYLYVCSHLDIDYFNSLDWYWLLPLLSRYHPLYTTEPDKLLWTVPTLTDISVPVSIQIGPDIDWGHFRELVWNTNQHPAPGSSNNLEFFANSFLSCITELVALKSQLDAGDDVQEELETNVLHLHRLAYTLRFLNRETEFLTCELHPNVLSAVAAIMAARSGSEFFLDHFAMTTLLRLTRSHLGRLWSFSQPRFSTLPPYWGSQPLNVTYLPSGLPRLSEIVNGFTAVEPFRLHHDGAFGWIVMGSSPPKTLTDLYSDFLAVLIAKPAFVRNTALPGQPFVAARYLQHLTDKQFRTHLIYHRALGRLIGSCLRDPKLRHLLAPYWITSSEPSTILETIFFGSHHVRRGVYDILPYGALEEMFPNAKALVNSLEPLAAPV